MRCVQWRRDYSGMDRENVPVMRRSQSAARRDKVPALPQWNGRRMVARQMHDVRGERDNLKLGRNKSLFRFGHIQKGRRETRTPPHDPCLYPPSSTRPQYTDTHAKRSGVRARPVTICTIVHSVSLAFRGRVYAL